MPSQRRSIPLMGLLCLMAGVGVMYSARRFAAVFSGFNQYASGLSGLIGVGLMLSGLVQIASRLRPRSASKVGRLDRNRVTLPREGLAYLVIMIVAFVASLLGQNNMLMLVFSIMAGPFILNGGIAFTMLQRNRLSRTLPERVMAGELFSVEITLTNRKFWFSSWLMLVHDRVARIVDDTHEDKAVSQLDPAVLFASVRPGQSRTGRYQLRLNQRGRYRFGPTEVSTRFPLGLVERGFVSELPGELLVHPRLGTLSPRWSTEASMASELVQRQRSRRGLFEDEFHHLRDYRPGDSPRSIHWRTSARQRGLMVREFQQVRDRALLVILDLWLPDGPAATTGAVRAAHSRAEMAISFTATICVEHLRQTRGVEQHLLIAGVETARLRADSGPAAIRGVLDALALTEPGPNPETASLLDVARHAHSSMTRVVVVTTRPNDATSPDALPFAELTGVEIVHATPQGLAGLFTLSDTHSDEAAL